jgi:hypothetical protein
MVAVWAVWDVTMTESAVATTATGVNWQGSHFPQGQRRLLHSDVRHEGALRIYAGLIIAAVLLFLPETALSLSQRIRTGTAIIVDGDTLIVNEQTIRLHGIDAPEVGQKCERLDGRRWHCGKAAMERLAQMAEGRTVTCSGTELDDYDRLIAVCR